jgi:hypothetical protein
MSDPLPVKCPACKKKSYGQNYSEKRLVLNDGVVKELGQQAERNRKAMGEELFNLTLENMQDEKTKRKKKLPKPWYRSGDKPLDLSKIKDKKKFIETGEKN